MGVAMRSSLGPSLANSNLAHYEQIWLDDFPDEFKLVHYKGYGNDVFVIFRSLHHLEKFNEYLHTKHANTKFTNKNEANGSLPFLDVLISQNNNSFTTAVYHKPKFSGFYSNFNSFIADEQKNGLIFTLFFRIFSIVLNFFEVSWRSNIPKDMLKKVFPY